MIDYYSDLKFSFGIHQAMESNKFIQILKLWFHCLSTSPNQVPHSYFCHCLWYTWLTEFSQVPLSHILSSTTCNSTLRSYLSLATRLMSFIKSEPPGIWTSSCQDKDIFFSIISAPEQNYVPEKWEECP